MLKRYHHLVGGAFRFVDAVVIGGSWLLAYWLRFSFPIIAITKGLPKFEVYASLAPLVMAVWMVVFEAMHVYQSRRMLRRTHEVHLLLRAHGTALLVFIAVTYIFSEYRYSRAVMIYFGLTGAILLVTFRLTLRNLLRNFRRKGHNVRHLICVGEGPALETLLGRLKKFPELGLRVSQVLGSERFDKLGEVVRSQKPDQVVIVLPRKYSNQLDSLIGQLGDEPVEVRIIPDVHEYVTLGCEVEDFDGLPIVNLNHSPLTGWAVMIKRGMDLVLSFLALVILSPLLLLIAILVKLSSRGPIFYTQERMGLDGQTFQMIKFRSMRVDAEAQSGAVWAQKDDPRKTRLGSFLRATSLDELPQFWNVFKGDMSLVGPRPERPVFVTDFRKNIPHYMLRHKVKAGITGWAQVNGWRGNTSLEKRIEFDLYYIRNWSWVLDLKILWMTLWRGFINKNAY